MVIPARGWGQEGARAGITIFAFSRPKSSKMVIPARGCEGTGNTRENHHFSIFNSQILQNRNSRAVGGGGGTRGNHQFGIFKAQILQNSDSRAGGGGGQGARGSRLENLGLQTPILGSKTEVCKPRSRLENGVCKASFSA